MESLTAVPGAAHALPRRIYGQRKLINVRGDIPCSDSICPHDSSHLHGRVPPHRWSSVTEGLHAATGETISHYQILNGRAGSDALRMLTGGLMDSSRFSRILTRARLRTDAADYPTLTGLRRAAGQPRRG